MTMQLGPSSKRTCVCMTANMHMSALAVWHKEVVLRQALVEVSKAEADPHGHQPVISSFELWERLAQVDQDAV